MKPSPQRAVLTEREAALLALLIEHQRLSASAAGTLLGLSASAISRLGRSLTESGFAQRANDPTDYRIVLMSPTAMGRSFAAGKVRQAHHHQQKDTTNAGHAG